MTASLPWIRKLSSPTCHENVGLKEFVKFLNDMWHSNCMDKETFMQKDDQYLAKIASEESWLYMTSAGQ